MEPEITATLIAIASAAGGYALREFRNRARPFLAIEAIDGRVQRNVDSVAVPTDVRSALAGSFYVKELDPTEDVRAIDETWDRADDVARMWPEMRARIDRVIGASTDDEFRAALPELLKLVFFERIAMKLLVRDELSFAPPPADAKEWIAVSEDTDKKGCVWFHFPGQTYPFGNTLSHATVRAKVMPFIEAVRFGQSDAVRAGLKELRRRMEAEFQAAVNAVAKLRNLLDEHLRWGVQFYFANLSASPVVVHKAGTLTVTDPSGLRATEECYLAVVKTSSEGREYWSDANSPIVVRGHEDARLVLITRQEQNRMKLGKALRETFDRGAGTFELTMTVNRIGLIRTQVLRTPAHRFSDTEPQKGTQDSAT